MTKPKQASWEKNKELKDKKLEEMIKLVKKTTYIGDPVEIAKQWLKGMTWF